MKRIILTMLCIASILTASAQSDNLITDKGYVTAHWSYYTSFQTVDGVLYQGYETQGKFDKDVLVKYPQNKTDKVFTVESWMIAKNAFKGNPHIEVIRIPSFIQYIGENAFDNCPNLRAIEMYEANSTHVKERLEDVVSQDVKEIGRYNINGVKVEQAEDGKVQIILYSDGTSQKILNK